MSKAEYRLAVPWRCNHACVARSDQDVGAASIVRVPVPSGFLIKRQHDGVIRRIQIKPDDIDDLLGKMRAVTDLAMGLMSEAAQVCRTYQAVTEAYLAIKRTLQCVASRGTRGVVRVRISWIF